MQEGFFCFCLNVSLLEKKERNLIYVQRHLDKMFQLNHDFKNQFMLSMHPIVFYLFDSSGHLTLTPILIIFVYHIRFIANNPRILYIIILK